MEVFEYATYLCCGVVCFVIAMFLLNIKNGYDNGREFRKVKRFLALALFIETLKDLLCAILVHRVKFLILSTFSFPRCCCFSRCMQ